MARKGKRPGGDAIQAALSILEEMSKSDGEVHVMVLGPLFMLTFRAKVKKHAAKGWYKLSTEAFNLNIAPEMSETIALLPRPIHSNLSGVISASSKQLMI